MASEESYPDLISLAVHELRTPANVVWGYLKMLQRDAPGLGAHERQLIDAAEHSCTRLAELMTELSQVGKLDAGQFAMALRPVDVFGLAAEAAARTREGEDRGLRLDVRGQGTGATIEADPDRLRTAMAAIFRSVLRERPGPSTFVVDRTRQSVNGVDTAIITVADESRMSAGDASDAGAFNDKRGGMGLALPVARRIIDAHDGQLVSRPDGGAVITFPLAT